MFFPVCASLYYCIWARKNTCVHFIVALHKHAEQSFSLSWFRHPVFLFPKARYLNLFNFGFHFCFIEYYKDLFFFFCFAAANEIPITPLPQVRDRVTDLCISILHSYRKFCATVSSSGQLILPEALKLLPLYTLGLFSSLLKAFYVVGYQ